MINETRADTEVGHGSKHYMNIVGCDYISLLDIPAFGNEVYISWIHIFAVNVSLLSSWRLSQARNKNKEELHHPHTVSAKVYVEM